MAKKKKYYSMMDESMRSDREGDSGMIKNDYSAPSNFPQKSFIKQYPEQILAGDMDWMDDTLSGIDNQMGSDARGIRRNRAKRKY